MSELSKIIVDIARTIEPKQPSSDVFPITEMEEQKLYSMGWNSGYGWEHEFDYWVTPSAGPDIHIQDDQKYMAQFLSDLKSIRHDAFLDRCRESGPDLYDALLAVPARYRHLLGKVQNPPTDTFGKMGIET